MTEAQQQSLADLGISINPLAPKEAGPRYEYLLEDADWAVAIDIAKKHREHHPDVPVEIWPRGGSHSVDVVKEVLN